MEFHRSAHGPRTRLDLVAAPTARPVTLSEVKKHLRVEHDDDNAMIDQFIDAAIAHFDGRDGWLGRAMIEQTWELRLDCFPPCIELPLPPLIEIVSIKYLDRDGALQTLDPAAYQVEAGGFRTALVAPALHSAWPATQGVPQCVRVEFTAGYALASSDSPAVVEPGVPPPLAAALKLQVELFYGRNVTDAALLQSTIDTLAGQYRIWS